MTQHGAKRAVIDRLVAGGWTNIEHPPFTAVASQTYATATVPKDAVLYWYASSEGNSLVGHYWSEGHNVLASCVELFDVAASHEEIAERVGRFLQRVQMAVDGSYARRLFLLSAGATTPA